MSVCQLFIFDIESFFPFQSKFSLMKENILFFSENAKLYKYNQSNY